MNSNTYLTLLLGAAALIVTFAYGWVRSELRHRERNRDLLNRLRTHQITAETMTTELIELRDRKDELSRALFRAKAEVADTAARADAATRAVASTAPVDHDRDR